MFTTQKSVIASPACLCRCASSVGGAVAKVSMLLELTSHVIRSSTPQDIATKDSGLTGITNSEE